jgi:acetyl esterase/lipase
MRNYSSIFALIFACTPLVIGYAADNVSTFTYNTVGNLEIKLDLHRAGDTGTLRPVVVWIHGGALINGNRAGIPERLAGPLLEAGCAIVSIDYRLAPETKLPEIIADLEDAFTWIRRNGRERLHVDTHRLAVAGGSAGGYLTLMAGYRVTPHPLCLVSLWGYGDLVGDLVGDWYSTPSPHARHATDLSRDEAYRQVSGPPVSDSRERKGDGNAFYRYCRYHGIWPQAVSGWDPHREAEKFAPYMPLMNITADYPPTLMIHGTKDTDVPYDNAVLMAEQFRRHGVNYELITIEGGEHGLAGGDPQKIDQSFDAAVSFIKRSLGITP